MKNQITEAILGGAFDVHRELGPGLLDSAREERFCYEWRQKGLTFLRPASLPLFDKGITLDCGYRIDLLAEDAVSMEMNSVDGLIPVPAAPVLAYLRLLNQSAGLQINCNAPVLRKGRKRVVNKFTVQPPRLGALAVESESPCSNVS